MGREVHDLRGDVARGHAIEVASKPRACERSSARAPRSTPLPGAWEPQTPRLVAPASRAERSRYWRRRGDLLFPDVREARSQRSDRSPTTNTEMRRANGRLRRAQRLSVDADGSDTISCEPIRIAGPIRQRTNGMRQACTSRAPAIAVATGSITTRLRAQRLHAVRRVMAG